MTCAACQSPCSGCVDSPHVLIADDFDNWTGHFLPIHVDSLQQGLQPAHVTFHMGVEEGEHFTYIGEKQTWLSYLPPE